MTPQSYTESTVNNLLKEDAHCPLSGYSSTSVTALNIRAFAVGYDAGAITIGSGNRALCQGGALATRSWP
jgi:hypothetical protein